MSILEKYTNKNGRFLLLKWKFKESIYVITKYYAATKQHEKDQLDFINFLKSRINKFDTENIITGGNFNFYINPDLDKQKNMNSRDTNPIYRQEIIALLESLKLSSPFIN